jgi:ATP-dependent DNA ligase
MEDLVSKRTGIMLCYPFSEERLNKWPKPWLVQPKLDGDRCRAIFNSEGRVKLLSSEENVISSVPHITQELEDMGLRDIELDGELYHHGASHQTIHGTVARTVNLHPEHMQVEYHVFDYVAPNSQLIRSGLLAENLRQTDHIKLVQTRPAENIEHIMNLMALYQEQGYEGIVVRNITYPYMRKRSTGMMKWKPRKSDYYVIVGYEEEVSINGDPKGSLGALLLEGEGRERFKVGSGSFLTRENRQQLWLIKESLIGKIAHVKYQHLTERHVPRFPVLIEVIKNMI